MNLSLPPDMEAGPVAQIEQVLDRLAVEHTVTIPLAIESGSRAWGFPSPDSDYDCRFVYVRPMSETFTLFSRRDVIEHPLSSLIDVSGWELSKALRLLLRGNAVIIEWLTSPFAYREEVAFRAAFLDLARRVADRSLIGRHYYHLAEGQALKILSDPDHAPLKKVFYVLSPLMALRWLTQHSEQSVAPMNFNQLCAEAELSDGMRNGIGSLLDQKRLTREIGTGPLPGPIAEFIRMQLESSGHWRDAAPSRDLAEGEALADQFWRLWIERLAPG